MSGNYMGPLRQSFEIGRHNYTPDTPQTKQTPPDRTPPLKDVYLPKTERQSEIGGKEVRQYA